MKRYRSLILIVLLGISMVGFSRNNDRNNNGRPGNYSNNGDRHNNNSRPGGNQNHNNGNNRPGNNSRPGNNNNNTNDRNPGWNNNNGSHNNNTGNSGKYCAEKKKNSNQCIRYENYNGGQLPNKPPKL